MAAAAVSRKRRRDSIGKFPFSKLPEEIIEHILSYHLSNLETKEAARCSILGKTWYNAWLRCPAINFYHTRSQSFFRYMQTRRAFRKFRRYNVPVEQLNLRLSLHKSKSRSMLDRCIVKAVKKGIKRLELDISIDSRKDHTLPAKLFEAESLRELNLISSDKVNTGRLALRKSVDDKVMFSHLRKLKFVDINIDDYLFEDIILSCPLIEYLQIYGCKLLKTIKVTKLYNLKELLIRARNPDVEIAAPNLRYLYCNMQWGSLKLHNLEKLKYLKLVDYLPSSIFSENLGHKFPQLEHLILLGLRGYGRIDISSHLLKRTKLMFGAGEVTEVYLDAPKMASLDLERVTGLTMANVPSQLALKIRWKPLNDYFDTNEFCKLKRLLANVNGSKISLNLDLCISDCRLIDLKQIPIGPAVEIEDLLWINCFSDSSTFPNILDALFLSCHPKAITVCDWLDNQVVILYKSMIERRNKELKEVKIEFYDESRHRWRQSNCTSLLERLPQWTKFCFKLEWKATLP